MNNERIIALSVALCQGRRIAVPALTPADWGKLLNHVAANREELHGAPAPVHH